MQIIPIKTKIRVKIINIIINSFTKKSIKNIKNLKTNIV